ncbi:MAG: hypothetical protein ACXAC8_08765 [Candidatus Hodarchaeales archaeon]|jgi:hypothetical protein
MSRHLITLFIPILVFSLLIFPNININTVLQHQNEEYCLNDDYSLSRPSFKLQQAFDSNKTLLPSGNFSVSEFLDDVFQFSYNATIHSINSTFWQVECNYSRTTDWFLQPFPNEFGTSVTRVSVNHSFFADNYYNWFGEKQENFDYWINTTGFFVGYDYSIGLLSLSVIAEDTIYVDEIGSFEAWKVNATAPSLPDPMTYWYSKDGLFLSLYLKYTSIFWWNLTAVDIAQLPANYEGPYLGQISPANNSNVTNGSVIDIQIISPYDINIINYQWDSLENQSSTFLQTIIPSENGSHDLYVTAIDNLGFYNHFFFSYFTDYSIPGIFLENIKNSSHLQGLSQIKFLISNGNGSLIYNWDGTSNITVGENMSIIIPNIEQEYELNIFVVSLGDLWVKKRYNFIVDNTPPRISLQNLINSSVIKGTVTFQTASSEISNITIKLNNETTGSFIAEADQYYDISFSNLENGSYELLIFATDEAFNINITKFLFSIYISAFNWNWDLIAYSPRVINLINASSDLWFILTLTSAVDQSFNISVLSEDSSPAKIDKMEYIIEFNCEEPGQIIFMTLKLKLNSNTDMFPIYNWAYWDSLSQKWLNISSVYNEVSHSWEGTYDGFVQYIALIKPDIITTIKSITPGGGQIPSFEIFPTVLSMFMISFVVYRKKKSKKSP